MNISVNVTRMRCVLEPYTALWYTSMYSVNIMECSLVAIAATMIRKSASDVQTSFYLLLTNLLISDLITFIFDLIAIIPHMFTCQNIFSEVGSFVLGSGNSISFICLTTNILIISINRYTSLCWSQYNSKVFTRKRTRIYAVLAWLIGFILVGLDYGVECFSKFSEASLFLTLHCSKMTSALSPHSVYCYFCTYGTFIFYLYCLRRMKRQRGQVANRQVANSLFYKQVQVFWQALLIWLSLVASLTSSQLLPLINDDVLYTVINTVFSLCCQYSIPIIPVIFSKDIRKMLKRLILIDRHVSAPLNTQV